ncbi:MAG: hypothetical protein V8Q31_01220 [Alistipes communis]
MKKLFLIVAAMFVAVSFSACSDDDDNKIDPNQIAERGKPHSLRDGVLITMGHEMNGLIHIQQ